MISIQCNEEINKQLDVDAALERLAIMTVDGGLTDEQARSELSQALGVDLASLDTQVDVGISEREDDVYRALKLAKKEWGEAYLECGKALYEMECCSCGWTHVVRHRCKLRVCSRCGCLRSVEVKEAYMGYVSGLRSDRLRALTLTLKNTADLSAGVDRIRKCFTRLRHRKMGKRIFGGLYGIEAKPDGKGKWNVHLHAIIEGVYISQKALSKAWLSITGDSSVVWIEKIKGLKGGKIGGDAERAVGYVTKYVAKGVVAGSHWTPELLADFALALNNVRLVQAFGSFLGKKGVRPPMVCPVCGGCMWRMWAVEGGLVFDDFGMEWDKWKSQCEYVPSYFGQSP